MANINAAKIQDISASVVSTPVIGNGIDAVTVRGKLKTREGIETGVGRSIKSGYLELTHDATMRALYSSTIFKGVPTDAADRDNKTVLSKKEIANIYYNKTEVDSKLAIAATTDEILAIFA